MPTVNPSPWGPRPQFLLANGLPAVGNKLFAYVAGTVNTKQDTFTDSTGTVANTNPLILNSLGEPTTEWWFQAGLLYKIVYAPATDTDPPTSPIWTIDNLRGQGDSAATVSEWTPSGITPTFVSPTQFTLPGDQTTEFQIARRIQAPVTAGISYSTITNSVFGALTTVTVDTTGSFPLDSGLTAVNLGVMHAINTSWPQLAVAGAGITITWSNGKPTISAGGAVPRTVQNAGLSVTMAANAVTIALKGANGADPSGSNAVSLGFRSPTLATGTSVIRTVSAALSTVISSGSTGGTVSTQASRIWIAAIDNNPTVEIAWYQSLSGTNIKGFDESGVISTTAEGGAGAADSAQTWYSTTARANVPFTILGYFDSLQTTAGSWAANPTVIAVNPTIRPCSILQAPMNSTGAVATGATAMPYDDTPPLIAEGTLFMTQAIVPYGTPNILRAKAIFNAGVATASEVLVALFRDATSQCLAATAGFNSSTNSDIFPFEWPFVANSTASTSITLRSGNTAGNTITFNGVSGSRTLGGSMNSQLMIQEECV